MNKKFERLIHPNLLNGSILKALLSFTLPIFISMIFQQLYNAVDTIIVGHYLKEQSLAAIGASSAIFELIVDFGTGFGNGMGLVTARAFGAGKEDRLKKSVASAIIITFFVTIFVMLAAKLGIKPLLRLLNTPAEILDESYSYISVVCVWCGVMFIYNLCSGMLRAIGNSFMPLVFLIFSSVLNIFLDIFFITKLGAGIRGAAYATVIAQGLSAILCLIYIKFRAKIIIPSAKKGHFSPDSTIYRDLLGQGLSMAFMDSLVSSGTVILQSAINDFGTKIIAGHIATRKIFSFSNIPIFTLGMATSTFVSQNYGARQFDRIKKGLKISCLITLTWAIFLNIVTPFIIRPLLIFMSGSTDEEIIHYGTVYLRTAYPFFIVLGWLVMLRNTLQGLGSKILPLISSIIELLGKILFTAFIIPRLKLWGIILCEPLIWCAMTAYLFVAYLQRIKTVQKEIA